MDKAVAKRKPPDLQRDTGRMSSTQGRLALKELTSRYLLTIQNQAPATVLLKTNVSKGCWRTYRLDRLA